MQTTGGYADWRLPTKKELVGIVDYGRYWPNASIDPIFTGITSWYWSSTTYAGTTYYTSYSGSAGLVNFDDGFINSGNKSSNYHYVRCVFAADSESVIWRFGYLIFFVGGMAVALAREAWCRNRS